MILTSEWVSLGHPDKLADFISCFILDRYLANWDVSQWVAVAPPAAMAATAVQKREALLQ